MAVRKHDRQESKSPGGPPRSMLVTTTTETSTTGRLPSSSADNAGPSTIEIPSTGLEFFEYRRKLFLAGLPLPPPLPLNSKGKLPETITVPQVSPNPLPPKSYKPSPKSAVGRLETLFKEPGSEDSKSNWKNLMGIWMNLTQSKVLTTPLRLGLVIKILKASWIQDGTWPLDPATSTAIKPPDSPTIIPASPIPDEAMDQDDLPTPGLAGLLGYPRVGGSSRTGALSGSGSNDSASASNGTRGILLKRLNGPD